MSNAVITKKETKKGSIAQLVQSVCLTSRGSGVRLPLLPPPEEKIFRSERPVCRENFVNSAPMGNMAAARPYRLVVHLSYNLCFTCYIIDL